MTKVLVLGASGYLGSHVTKQLVAAGRDVRIFVRPTSDTRATDPLGVEKCFGDVLDHQAVAAAMAGCDIVYHCIVDTRCWLRDTAPLFRVNVDGLRVVMDVALTARVSRFVFTSSFVTIHNKGGRATEVDEIPDGTDLPDYIRSRLQAERLLQQYCRDKGLPGIACCVGSTYGDGDHAPTPHGNSLRMAAQGRMPFYWHGGSPVIGVKDAARAMLQAEKYGEVGERYIIAERWMDYRELFSLAAAAAGTRPPRLRLPLPLLRLLGLCSEVVTRLLGKENMLNRDTIRCSLYLTHTDPGRAITRLRWRPRPVEESIREAVQFFAEADPDPVR